jgi:peptidoglycan/LPS O-acetylase OafA/YrhL
MIKVFEMTWESLIYKLTFVANFIPGELVKVNGPWWFVSLIVQFYLIFPLLLRLMQHYGTISLIVLSLSGLLMTAYLQPYFDFVLAATVITHLPELSFGIYMAYKKNISMKYGTIILISIIFFLSNIYSFFWYFSFISATILLLIFFQVVRSLIGKTIRKGIMFIGVLSMYIFFVHGFMREPWLSSAKFYDSTWYLNLLFSFLFLGFVLAASYLHMKLEKQLRMAVKNTK